MHQGLFLGLVPKFKGRYRAFHRLCDISYSLFEALAQNGVEGPNSPAGSV